MAQRAKLVSLVDVTQLVRAPLVIDTEVKQHLADTRRLIAKLERHLATFARKVHDLESTDRLGSFEIQDLMSSFNQAETLASNILKKRDETSQAIISKIA
jgi:hypothetical protein